MSSSQLNGMRYDARMARSVAEQPGLPGAGGNLDTARAASFLRPILRAPLWMKLIGANLVIFITMLFVVRRLAPAVGADAALRYVFLAALSLSMMITIALVLVALHPLRALERTAADVWKGNTDARVPPSMLADRDMARVGYTFNLLVGKLVEDRARFRDLAAYVISRAEAEQARIAYQLHESAAQQLAAQMMQLSAIAHGTHDPHVRASLMALRDMAADTLEQLRTLAHTMTFGPNLGVRNDAAHVADGHLDAGARSADPTRL